MPQLENGPHNKKAKFGSQNPDQFAFTNAHDIKQALQTTQDPNVLSKALFALRSKLSLKPGDIVAPHDERLSLAKLWMEDSPAAQDLFDVWGKVNEMSTQVLVMSLFSSLLSLFTCHLPDHSYGVPIIKTVLSPQWLRKLNSYISGSHNERILATLKLFDSISTFGSGRERKSVFEAFPWDNKSLPKLLYMRRRGKDSQKDDILVRPDIRTYYVLFILSMVDQDTAPSIKAAFLEQRREVFMSIFKGFVQDHHTVVQKVLQICWEGIWSDPKIKRTTKLGLFNEVTISHLLKLYDRAAAESPGGEHIPADIVHHFLLAICTHPGRGICFRDRGWYPRQVDEDGVADQGDIEGNRQKGAYAGKIFNKILANVLRALKVNEDPRQQELALKITTACPELVAGYWSAALLTLEPRLSSKWIANISFAGQILSQPVPVHSFLLSGSDELYNPTPPPLSIIMGNLLPPLGTKALFTKGLQATATPIVQHCTALALAKCLRKLAEVVRLFKQVEAALEEDEEEGQWSRQRREVEKEARRRVPEFQVIVAFSQQFLASSNTTKHALLSESSQRLLWLYQECLPDVVAEARFEVGKLVAQHNKRINGEKPLQALQSVKHLHVLRLLSGNDQFAWAGKAASSTHTYLYVILKTFCNSRVRALRATLMDLLQHVLSESVLFQEDQGEVEIWLAALPFHFVRRGQGTEAPDGVPLTDEVDAIVSFLDDCAQRCLKTPYRYMEAMSTLVHSSTSDADIHRGELFASPLLMTVLEQVIAKVSGRLMTPSDTLAVFTFVRRLLVMLATKQDDPGYHSLLAILDQLDNNVTVVQPFPNQPSICYGVRRELSIARACLRHLGTMTIVIRSKDQVTRRWQPSSIVSSKSPSVSPIPQHAKRLHRCSLSLLPWSLDWLRLVDVKPSAADISRLASVVRRFYEPALWALVDHLHPSDNQLWNSDILKYMPVWPPVDGIFGWLYIHCTLPQLQNQQTCGTLLISLSAHPVTLTRLEHAIRFITHDITMSMGRHDLTAALLSLLSDVLARAKSHLNEKDLRRLKASIVQCDAIHGLCVSEGLADQTIRGFVAVSFNPANAEDQTLLSPIGSHWADMMTNSLPSGQFDELKYAQPWIKFMGTEELLAAVDLIRANFGQRRATVCDILEDILAILQYRTPRGSSPKIPAPKLLELQAVLPGSTLLEDMLSETLVSQLPSGFDGYITFTEGQLLSTVISRTKPTHLSDLRSLPVNLTSQLLEKETWTGSTGGIIVALLYSNPPSVQAFATWLDSKGWTRLDIHLFAPVLAAFLDCIALTSGDLSQAQGELDSYLRYKGAYRVSPSWILRLKQRFSHASSSGSLVVGALTTSIVDRALQWAVRHLSDDTTDSRDSNAALKNLRYVAIQEESLKPHLVEPLLTTLVRRHLSDASMLDLAVALIDKTPLKPVVVNRLLQNVLQHQHFVAVCGKHGTPSQRSQATRLLDALFRLHPANTCQPSHIEPLFQVYGGTMSLPDRRILSIMRLFEGENRTSLSAFFSRWSLSPDATVSDALEVVQNFDPVYMLRTCLAFPSWRRLGEEKGPRDGPADDSMYDPLMAIVLSAQMLVECPPTTPLGWVKVFRSNVVSLLIRCLSSKDPNIRETALCQIASLEESVQKSDMHETPQVLYVFRLLRNVLDPPPNASDPPRRLPTFTALILLHALRGIFYPSNFIYPRTARFLLQRPELDVSDVPMLFGMLYSNSDDWKKERGWMLRMLGDGMASTDDWKVLKRRHTWDLVASLFQSSRNDTAVRAGILEILANLTCNPQACTSLVLKSSLLSWIEMQVGDNPGKESMAWLRVLENVLVVADISNLTRATGDQWCSTICRCVSVLLRNKALFQAYPVILSAMSSRAPWSPCNTSNLRSTSINRYADPSNPTTTRHLRDHHIAPKDSTTVPATLDPLRTWDEIVEALWRAAMAPVNDDDDGTHGTWTMAMLTRRLLVWRALVGEEACPVGEWARREVVLALRGAM
ncbi:ribosome 60S biogenesis N-terminal-domain-containing protein [Boletus reticuloceps]|uniref:Ribosome 60S biogenesis N-terminal-domain-containing protein n=1 Tax=Boletus reticuloceps TaxID=495285 RepID=A0A8I3A9K7_9AGAM|nr:ribosome 60S biogenesis N-terminal-domain-containing protein [Boletus reticuloceps]